IARLDSNRNGIIWLVHLLPAQVYIGGPSDAAVGDYQIQQARRTLIQEAAQRLGYLNYRILIGQAAYANRATAVLETAFEIGADLIIMATHGRRGLSHLMWGSVAEEVTRRASCPVLSVGPGVTRPREPHALLRFPGPPADASNSPHQH
ncbi:MAG: universal stress protein, partial [Candidatus Binataceae bacterium]